VKKIRENVPAWKETTQLRTSESQMSVDANQAVLQKAWALDVWLPIEQAPSASCKPMKGARCSRQPP